MSIENLVADIRSHRCYSHPVFEHWGQIAPSPTVLGALFHHIRCFCDSTRPGLNLPSGMKTHGLDKESVLLQEIVESEEDHGPQLATMAGHIINRASEKSVFTDLYNQEEIETHLKECSDLLLSTLPGYDKETGLMPQTRKAISVFKRRILTDEDSIYRNLGTALALEMISNRQLIPGEKHCLVDCGLYDTSLNDPEMHYLKEHYGESGAESQHENNAIEAIASIINYTNRSLIKTGVDDFLSSLTALWDLLDSALLESGKSKIVIHDA